MTEPERSCIVTRRVLPKQALIRFVIGPGDVLVPDIAGKLPGRGLYLSASRLTLAEAIARRHFARVARQAVTVPEGLAENLHAQLEQRVVDALSLTRKAGLVIAGYEKIEAAARAGGLAALLHAQDAGADGIRKLESALTAGAAAAPGSPVAETFRLLPRARLSAVLGRDNAAHAAIAHGPAAQFFIAEARRFALFLD